MPLEPFEVLLDGGPPSYRLPEPLARLYGALGFVEPVLFANFVSSLDGVATLGDLPSAGSLISGRNAADRFLMGLLRACADAVLIGAGTLRATPGHVWTPAHVAPDFAADFIRMREVLRRSAEPRLVVLTASGGIDATHTAIRRGATVVTTSQHTRALRSALPSTCEVIASGDGAAVDVRQLMVLLRERGYSSVLTEGGPHVMGELIKQRLLQEIFLTMSPVLAGRDRAARQGMVSGVELLPEDPRWCSLLSARRHGDHLFLRYRLNLT